MEGIEHPPGDTAFIGTGHLLGTGCSLGQGTIVWSTPVAGRQDTQEGPSTPRMCQP